MLENSAALVFAERGGTRIQEESVSMGQAGQGRAPPSVFALLCVFSRQA